MNSNWTRFAGAAAVLIAAMVAYYAIPSKDRPASTAFGAVVQQIDKAHSVTYTRTVQEEGEKPTSTQQMMLQDGRARTITSNGNIRITHPATGDSLSIRPERKLAQLSRTLSSQEEPGIVTPDWISTRHEREGVYTGQGELAGQVVNVYTVDKPYEKTTIWTDPRTNLPVQVETQIMPATDKDFRPPRISISEREFLTENGRPDKETAKSTTITAWGPGLTGKKKTITLSNFAWNVELDESLFRLAAPDGYELVRDTVDYGQTIPPEKALAQALRFWAETSDGRFPDEIDMLADMKAKLISRYRRSGKPQEAYRLAVQMANVTVNGLHFAQQRRLEGNWHYAGKNMILGDAAHPLAWWREADTGPWHVVYGDLSIKKLPPDQLPVPVSTKPTTSSTGTALANHPPSPMDAGADPQAAQGGLTGMDTDDWTQYVLQFITEYRLDRQQQDLSWQILAELKKRRREYEVSHRAEYDTVAKIQDPRRRAEVTADLKMPIDTMLTELKTRLDVIPTASQRKLHRSAATVPAGKSS